MAHMPMPVRSAVAVEQLPEDLRAARDMIPTPDRDIIAVQTVIAVVPDRPVAAVHPLLVPMRGDPTHR